MRVGEAAGLPSRLSARLPAAALVAAPPPLLRAGLQAAAALHSTANVAAKDGQVLLAALWAPARKQMHGTLSACNLWSSRANLKEGIRLRIGSGRDVEIKGSFEVSPDSLYIFLPCQLFLVTGTT